MRWPQCGSWASSSCTEIPSLSQRGILLPVRPSVTTWVYSCHSTERQLTGMAPVPAGLFMVMSDPKQTPR